MKIDTIKEIKEELSKYIEEDKAEYFPRFFKTGPGEYGEGDKFIGVRVPFQRKVAKKYYKYISLEELEILLKDPIHEYRLTALIILVNKFNKAKTEELRKSIVEFYLKNIDYVNNWDLVDSSADKILGEYLLDKEKDILYEFAETDHLWKQRISIMSTFRFIRNEKYEDTLKIAEILLNHEHDLIHKAVGWMLREVGKRDFELEFNFLQKHYKTMPRTMLRYAIEKFDQDLRKKFLKGEI